MFIFIHHIPFSQLCSAIRPVGRKCVKEITVRVLIIVIVGASCNSKPQHGISSLPSSASLGGRDRHFFDVCMNVRSLHVC